jgi:hypothetical protein
MCYDDKSFFDSSTNLNFLPRKISGASFNLMERMKNEQSQFLRIIRGAKNLVWTLLHLHQLPAALMGLQKY